MSREAMKLKTAAEKVVELCGERPLSLGKWFIDMGEACESLREALAEQPAQQGQSCYCPNCEAMSKELAAQRKPLTLQELKAAWNAQADKFNQWDELGVDEIVAWAQAAHNIKENT